MRKEHVGEVDLNLLRPLHVLLEERHVSRAAARVGLSQPAMSRALVRLRATFGDELLVRTSAGFERTACADRLLVELDELIPRLERTFRGDSFDPQTSRHVFRIAATEYVSAVLVPEIVKRLARCAPRMQLSVTSWNAVGMEAVESGRVDLALVGEHDCRTLESEKLFSDDFVCVASLHHPFRGKRMTLASFAAYPHVDIAVTGGGNPFIDSMLAAHGTRRRILFKTPFPISAALATATSDMIYTTPRRMAQTLQALGGVQIFEAPKELAHFTYAMAWHRRLREDVIQSWLRSLVAGAAETV
jgi:DNA-binding transcriptional LysR family regulator